MDPESVVPSACRCCSLWFPTCRPLSAGFVDGFGPRVYDFWFSPGICDLSSNIGLLGTSASQVLQAVAVSA